MWATYINVDDSAHEQWFLEFLKDTDVSPHPRTKMWYPLCWGMQENIFPAYFTPMEIHHMLDNDHTPLNYVEGKSKNFLTQEWQFYEMEIKKLTLGTRFWQVDEMLSPCAYHKLDNWSWTVTL